MAGRSVRLFLVDGTPQGMRTAEVGNWTGLALVCPRTDLARLGSRPEVKRTGVYILVGPSDVSTSEQAVYVGEGDEVWTRLLSHDDKKDFWTWAIILVSKDDNLTKAHVRWLEARLVREITAARRAEVKNGTGPDGGKLPEADVADMETYLEHVRLLLPTLGANVFEAPSLSPGDHASLKLELKWEDAKAECVVRDGQFVVTEGSTARVKEVDSLQEYVREQRRRLRKSGVLVPMADGALFRFVQEYAFDSPSAAAGVVTGTSVNGRAHWKVKDAGLSYRDWQEKQLEVSEAEPRP